MLLLNNCILLIIMEQGTNLSSVIFSPELIQLKHKLIQPSVLSFPETHLNFIDTQKLKIPKQKSQHPPLQDPKQIQKALLRSIEQRKEDSNETKQKMKNVKSFIERERYILPPLKNIRKIMKDNPHKEKNEHIINSYITDKDLTNFITPIKKKQRKQSNSSSKMERDLQSFLKKSKSKSKKIVYYRPEQVRKNTLLNDHSAVFNDSRVKHFKSEIKLGVPQFIRKRTKTEMKSHQTQEFDFFKMKTCFNQPEYVFFDQISNPNKLASSRLNGPPRALILPKQEQLKDFLAKYEPMNEEIQVKALIKSNFCSVEFSQHEIYVGEMSGKVRSGMGLLFANDLCFEGLWKNNQRIKGVEITNEGVYKGYFSENRREGKGQFQWSSGELYVGHWAKGHQHGEGMWINSRGESYKGEWRNGKAEGLGSLIIKSTHNAKSGRRYKGAFLNNKQHGFGRQSFANGDSYEGLYRDDKPSGKGTYYWANGSTYQGQFFEGIREGMGVLKTSFNLVYKGEFRDDCPQGECQIIMPNGDTYYGMVKDGKKNGKGTLSIQKSQEIFNGYWRNDNFVSHHHQHSTEKYV